MSQIPLDNHPHILDSILAAAPYESLVALRAASRVLRDRADRIMLYHIELGVDANARMYGGGLVPREGWIDYPELADTVRIVDVHLTSNVFDVTPPPSPPPKPLWPEDWDAECAEVYAKTDCPCQGDEGIEAHRKLRELGSRLHHVKLVRRWGVHACPTPVAAPREVTFTPRDLSRRAKSAETVRVSAKTSVLRISRVNYLWTKIDMWIDHNAKPELLIYRVWPVPNTKPPKEEDWDTCNPDNRDNPPAQKAYMMLIQQLTPVLMSDIPITFVGLDQLDLDSGLKSSTPVLEQLKNEMNTRASYGYRRDSGVGHMINFMTLEEYEASTDPEIIALEEFDGDINDPNRRG